MAPASLTLTPTTYRPPTLAANTAVGTLTATDPNSDEVLSFALVGGADVALFTLSGATLALRAAGTTGTNFAVSVRVTDGGGLSLTQAFTITDRCVLRVSPPV